MKTGAKLLLLAVIWALVYALPAVPLEGLPNIGVQLPWWAYEVDMWPMTLGIPGFIGGLIFGAALALSGRLRAVEAMGNARLVAWGIASGLLVAGFLRMLNGPPASANFMLLVVGLAVFFGALAAPVSAWILGVLERRLAPAGTA